MDPQAPQPPDSDRCLEIIESIVAQWRADRSASTVASASGYFAPVLFSTVAHLVTLADGLSVLWRSSTDNESRRIAAMPIIRQMLEFGMQAMWLELFRDDVESFVREGARQRFNALNEAVNIGAMSEDSETVKDSANFLDQLHADFDVKHFQHVCKSLAGGEAMYLHYRVASNFVHPSLYQGDLYLTESERPSGIEFVTTPQLPSSEAWLGTATCFLVSGCLAWERADPRASTAEGSRGMPMNLGSTHDGRR